jgi:hypothetical protein
MEYIKVAKTEQDELMGKYERVAIDEDSSVSSDSVKSALGGVLVENLKFRADDGWWNNLVIKAEKKIGAGIRGWTDTIYVVVQPNSGKYTAVLLNYSEFKFPETISPSKSSFKILFIWPFPCTRRELYCCNGSG